MHRWWGKFENVIWAVDSQVWKDCGFFTHTKRIFKRQNFIRTNLNKISGFYRCCQDIHESIKWNVPERCKIFGAKQEKDLKKFNASLKIGS